jgi:hypothetical protein
MAGSEMSQNKKKHTKSRVFVPEDAGRLFAVSIELANETDMAGGVRRTNILNTRPHRSQHNFHALSTNPCLHTVPDTSRRILSTRAT